MKLYLFLVTFLIFFVSISAQNLDVPKEVKTAFNKLYPDVTNVKWSKEGDKEFEAEFKMNDVKTSVVLDEEGEVEETETAIDIKELPATALDYIKANYSGYDISEAAKIVDEDNNTTYEAEISKDNSHKDLIFDKEGKLVKKEIEQNEKEDKED